MIRIYINGHRAYDYEPELLKDMIDEVDNRILKTYLELILTKKLEKRMRREGRREGEEEGETIQLQIQ
ncbi:MAG: hypothetical protein QXI43_00035 [Candidatus Nitrosocaldus sp.]